MTRRNNIAPLPMTVGLVFSAAGVPEGPRPRLRRAQCCVVLCAGYVLLPGPVPSGRAR
eukprot:SAG25_NODE_7353_length_485_cov_2.549223_2_plen_57_part_01